MIIVQRHVFAAPGAPVIQVDAHAAKLQMECVTVRDSLNDLNEVVGLLKGCKTKTGSWPVLGAPCMGGCTPHVLIGSGGFVTMTDCAIYGAGQALSTLDTGAVLTPAAPGQLNATRVRVVSDASYTLAGHEGITQPSRAC